MARREVSPDLPAHTPGTPKGEERVQREGLKPGRQHGQPHRTARDSTCINAEAR
jgi:hypothetical protein